MTSRLQFRHESAAFTAIRAPGMKGGQKTPLKNRIPWVKFI